MTILIIAGPNGAGKTTFALEYVPNEGGCPVFVNADLIAAGLNPFRPEEAAFRAGRLMLREIDEHARRGVRFAFETTLSGRGYAHRIPRWRDAGYRVRLVFLWLPTPEMAVDRVAQRVAQGGHGIPEPVIRRRFARGRRNFEGVYRSLVDECRTYDNSGRVPVLRAEGGPAVTTWDRVSTTPPGDPDFTGVEAALRRAAARARREAAAAGAEVVVFRDGKVVREKPGRESGSAPGSAVRQMVDAHDERPEDTRPHGGRRDGSGVR